jgi:putative hydrolase of the HAD superfamily
VSGLPRAILFDLDGTILFEGRRRQMLQEIAERYADHFAPFTPTQAADRLEAQFEDFWADGERHRQWRQKPLEESRRHVAEQAFLALRAAGAAGLDTPLAHAFGAEFHTMRQAVAGLFPDAVQTLVEIRRRGVAMALVTNGSSVTQRQKIARFELAAHFDHIQIEAEHGFGKPEARAYHHALAALGVAAHDTWMVGDNLEWEVAAPQALGIKGIWLDAFDDGLPPGSTIVPNRIIRTLSELLEPTPAG